MSVPPLLVVEALSKRFQGLLAVNGVSFSVAPGEIVGLIGPNGAGKTTTFEMISGFVRPTAGKVTFDGRHISGTPPHRLARIGIGRTFQIVQPFLGLSVLENVMIGVLGPRPDQHHARERAMAVLAQVGLDRRAAAQARSLTLPEKKRLELARAVATSPRLLLLDEVMAGLTPAEIDQMMPILRSLRGAGMALLVVEHVMRAVMNLSDRIVVMANGSKIAEGTPAEIGGNEAVIAAYLGRRHDRGAA